MVEILMTNKKLFSIYHGCCSVVSPTYLRKLMKMKFDNCNVFLNANVSVEEVQNVIDAN